MESSLPPLLAEIVQEFALCEGREKIELLLQYSEHLPPLPAHLAGTMEKEAVPECTTPVFVQAETKDGHMIFHFEVPPESPTVRGFANIIRQGLHNATPQQVLALPNDFYRQMGLEQVLTHQRLNGMAAIVAHVKRLALAALQEK